MALWAPSQPDTASVRAVTGLPSLRPLVRAESTLPNAVELERAGVRFESRPGVERLRTGESSLGEAAFVVRQARVFSTTDLSRDVKVLTYETKGGETLAVGSSRPSEEEAAAQASAADAPRSESTSAAGLGSSEVSTPADTAAAPVDDTRVEAESGPSAYELLLAQFTAKAEKTATVKTQNTSTPVYYAPVTTAPSQPTSSQPAPVYVAPTYTPAPAQSYADDYELLLLMSGGSYF